MTNYAALLLIMLTMAMSAGSTDNCINGFEDRLNETSVYTMNVQPVIAFSLPELERGFIIGADGLAMRSDRNCTISAVINASALVMADAKPMQATDEDEEKEDEEEDAEKNGNEDEQDEGGWDRSWDAPKLG